MVYRRPPAPRRRSGGSDLGRTVRKKLASSMLAAAVGAAAGYGYATRFLSEELQETKSVFGMYVVLGAVLAVLGLRLFGIFRTILSDYGSKKDR